MPQPRLQTVVQHLRKLVDAEERVADAELLERFVARRDEAAFTMLVQRHGPMVLGICRRMLRKPADAEDAWQATFLVLARKASSIRKQASIAAWLHGVALRICQRTRDKAQRNRHSELPGDLIQADHDELSWREVQRILDEEIEKLPERLRQPIVLCYLEGRTRDEAAEELGWTLSTFRGRLDTARERLRKGLIQRGLTLPTALLATLLSQAGESAAIPQALLDALLPAAVSGSAPIALAPLVEGGMQAMSVSKVPALLSVVLAVGLFGGGSALLVHNQGARHDSAGLRAAENPAAADSPKKEGQPAEASLEPSLAKMVEEADRIVLFRPGKENQALKGPNGDLNVQAVDGADMRPLTKGHNTNYVLFLRAEEDSLPAPKLYPLRPKDWYVEHTPELEKKIRKAIALPRTWGETKNGLRLGLRPHKITFQKTDDIAVDVAIQNAGDKDASLKQLRYNIHDYWFITFPVETPTGRVLTISKPATEFTEFDIPKTRVLKPGETYVHTVRLNRWFKEKDNPFTFPGEYTIAASYFEPKTGERVPKDYLATDKITIEVADADPAAERLKDVEAHLDRLQMTVTISPAEGNAADPKYPLRYVVLNVLPIPIEPHGRWPNGKEQGADAIITRAQAGAIAAALNRLDFFRDADIRPDPAKKIPFASIKLVYRPDGARENKVLCLTLDWNAKLLLHLRAIRGCVDGDAARHLDAMLLSLEPDRKKWETEGLSLDKMHGRWRLIETEWKGRGWPLAEGVNGTLIVNADNAAIELTGENNGGAIPTGYRFDGKLVFEAPPDQPLNLFDRADLAEGRWFILRGAWSTPARRGGSQDEPVWYHPAKQLLRMRIPGQQTVYLVFQRDEAGWGVETEGLSLRARPAKTVWKAGEQPTFEIDLRNRGTKSWNVTAVPPLVEVEVDGKWYAFSGELDYRATVRTLKPGDTFDKWMTVAPDKTWGQSSDNDEPRMALEWKPGKHKVRLAYSIRGKVYPHSEIVEITVAENRDADWGEAVQGLQLRLRSMKAKWQFGEQPVFELDLRNRGTQTISTLGNRYEAQFEVDGRWYNLSQRIDINVPERKLDPNHQFDAWITAKPDNHWIHQTEAVDPVERPLPLRWNSGKRKVRAGYRINNQIFLYSNTIEIEIVDPKDAGWGAADGGISTRLWSGKSTWAANETPTLYLDVRYRGTDQLRISNLPTCKLHVDGEVYFHPDNEKTIAGFTSMGAGAHREKLATLSLDSKWILESDYKIIKLLRLAPGKHTIRVTCHLDRFKPVSNTIEIEIVDPKGMGWGKAEDGFQIRARSDKATYRLGEVPVLEVDLRNQGKTEVTSQRFPHYSEIEVDGVWYFVPVPDIGAPERKIMAGEHIDKWATLRLDNEAWQIKTPKEPLPPTLKLAHGKHRVRVLYPISGKIRPISEPIEFEIVDPKELGWGEPVQGVQIRLRQVKSLFNPQEEPVFEIDLRNRGEQAIDAEIWPPDIEFDGVWYQVTNGPGGLLGAHKIKAGEVYSKWAAFLVGEKAWVTEEDGEVKPRPLRLTIGKHTIRAAYPVTKEIRALSETITFEIRDPKEVG